MIESKGKKTSIKNEAKVIEEDISIQGRPLKYTPETLEATAEKYFNNCDENNKPKTLSGLCLRLKVNKDYISEKAKKDDFSETIKQIRLVVENNIEEGILTNAYNPTSGIFNLKNNFNWVDKHEIDQTTKQVNYSKEEWKNLSDDELEKISNGE